MASRQGPAHRSSPRVRGQDFRLLEVRVLIDSAARRPLALRLNAADLLTTVQAGRGGAHRNAPALPPPAHWSAPLRLFGRTVCHRTTSIRRVRLVRSRRRTGLPSRSHSPRPPTTPTATAASTSWISRHCSPSAASSRDHANPECRLPTPPDRHHLPGTARRGRITDAGCRPGRAHLRGDQHGRRDAQTATASAPTRGQCTAPALTESNWNRPEHGEFNLPGPAPVTIQVGSSSCRSSARLEQRLIDGYSQPGSQPIPRSSVPTRSGVMVRGNGNSAPATSSQRAAQQQ
jgi:hypothetical protein